MTTVSGVAMAWNFCATGLACVLYFFSRLALSAAQSASTTLGFCTLVLSLGLCGVAAPCGCGAHSQLSHSCDVHSSSSLCDCSGGSVVWYCFELSYSQRSLSISLLNIMMLSMLSFSARSLFPAALVFFRTQPILCSSSRSCPQWWVQSRHRRLEFRSFVMWWSMRKRLWSLSSSFHVVQSSRTVMKIHISFLTPCLLSNLENADSIMPCTPLSFCSASNLLGVFV